jgi:cytochrome P450
MTFDVIGKAGFGFDFNSLKGSKNEELLNMKAILNSFFHFPSILFKSYYENLPLKRNIELKKSYLKIDQWIDNIISQRREEINSSNQQNQGFIF